MDVHAFLRSRRSIRRFQPEPVPDSVVERILTTAVCAPSAHNLQPWRFVQIQQRAARAKLASALIAKMRADMQAQGAPTTEIETRTSHSALRIDRAPVLILLCRELQAVRVKSPEENVMAIQSVAAAGLQLLLAAQAEGLGGSWCCWPLYAPEELRTALDLPGTWNPEALFFLGAPAGIPEAREPRPLEAVVAYR
jgi:coenzyme F420-0:L-glutamate ligase / coenzyme F420-1:gamma-L-glutamate ligase